MAKVSISEASKLVNVSRPTLYKMINSGELVYNVVVKGSKAVKVVDTSELIRVFGELGCKAINDKFTPLNSVVDNELQDLQHQLAMLKQENQGLKEGILAREAHIDSLRKAMQLLEHKPVPVAKSPWWKFW